MNLAVNARDAMTDGGRLIVRTTNQVFGVGDLLDRPEVVPGEYVVLTVSDTGCGMSAEVQDKVFEPFFTTKAVGEGTGLGLATVHGIVRQSGGHIWLYSEPGVGTTFRICLPRLVGPGEPAPEGRAEPAMPPPGGTETVLVVEDDASVRSTVCSILVEAGYTTLEAANGVIALEMLGQADPLPDLVLTDLVMPVMKGPELARCIVARWPEMRIVFMSGYSAEVVEMHVDLGDFPVVQKPSTVNELRATVRRALDGRAPRLGA